MTDAKHSPSANPKPKRFWPWILAALLAVLVSGLIPPSAIGLEPTLVELEQRAQELSPGATVREVADALGMEPVVAELRRFPSPRPLGDIERVELSGSRVAAWSARPEKGVEGPDDVLLISLKFESSRPWLLNLGQRIADRFPSSNPAPGVPIASVAAALEESERWSFVMSGSPDEGWFGWRTDSTAEANAAEQRALSALMQYVSPEVRATFRSKLPPGAAPSEVGP